ncbi:MAG: hypothetical protein NZ555_13320 [Geminicoccaceae bacterium]|nr:hypothetical protein [Geminicoccaceae bacterium]MCX8100399.1 hypothetical protein [Geminicoccaceae bacterium]MDW8371659.1 hypothetical protein [Geminicoccaceae bacterium]
MSEPRPTPVPPSPPDLAALLAVQQRLFEAFARSGRIVAEAARGCAERQAAIARMTLDDLLAAGLPGEPAANLASLQERAARLGSLLEQIGQEIGALQRILAEAQLAMLEELRRAWQPTVAETAAAEPATAPAAEPAPVASAAAPVAETAGPAESPAAEEAPSGEAEAGPEENGEAAKKSPARRSRKIAANG